ncbi:hypothetical protein [Lysinibacillus sp. NPDC056185]|uniref:hypothetical protein n=1 Tax=Lysinibacillus sp. NPDC056185 TaxID=3345739 RepID=UPI0039EE54CC
MATQIKVTMNRAGMRTLLLGPQVRADLAARAQRIATAADIASRGKHRVTVGSGRNRTHVFVTTADTPARVGEARSRTLTRAVNAGRGR